MDKIQHISAGLYVTADGSWGNADGMSIIDDSEWDDSDYVLLDGVNDGEKADLADAISRWITYGRPPVSVDEDELDGVQFAEKLLEMYGGYTITGWAKENGEE